jgi:hypothetical protein
MNITAAKMSGEEILAKYPILNTKWKYSNREYDWNGYNGYYYSNYKDWSTEVVTDPWYRAFKDYVPISDDVMSTLYHTTVEGNPVLLLMYKKKYV